LPALSVQWGAWAGTGLATQTGVLRLIKSWRGQGIAAMTEAVATAALERVLGANSGCVLVSPINWAAFCESRAGDDGRGLFAALMADGRTTAAAGDFMTDLRDRLRTATGSERRDLVRRGIREQLALVLRTDASRIDMDRPLGTVGLDSLMTVEFAKRVASVFALRLSATAVFSFPTLNALEREVTAQLDAAWAVESPRPSSAPPPPSAQDRPEESVADMSEEDAILALMSRRGADA
jgi:myxalamid-type polyketide synthase MxaE and MxaD